PVQRRKVTRSAFGADERRDKRELWDSRTPTAASLTAPYFKLRRDKMSDKDRRTPIKGAEDTNTSSCHYDVYLFDRSDRLRRFKTHSFSEWIELGFSLKVPS